MAGTASPGTEGPTVAPPHLPSGWIAQWDGHSRKYYFVELATGRSQWEVPTQPGLVGGGTPNHAVDHPYGIPGTGDGKGRIITHPDGSQTIQHPDGRKEPILPPGMGGPTDGTRGGPDGPVGDRGLGSFAQSALSSLAGGKKQSGGGSSNPLGDLASSLLGGNKHSSGGGGSSGKIVSQLASSIFSSGGDKPSQPTNYHGGQTQGQHLSGPSGGLAGHVMGGVASMFGGSSSSSSHNNFGYSNPGHSGPYSGPEPPISYMPPSKPGGGSVTSSSQQPTTHQQYGGHPQQHQQPQNYPPPPNQSYGQPPYGSNPHY